MIENFINIETKDGLIDTFEVKPDEGGPFPAIIIYMDAPAIREELRDMARRLASMGYYVLLPNLFYRVGKEGSYPFTFAKIREDKLINVINKIIDLRPKGIRKHLQLNRPIYSKTSAYGHFGRIPEDDGSFSWEKTDLTEDILSELT